jgi:transcriptional regulator with XRE-family HTH domain
MVIKPSLVVCKNSYLKELLRAKFETITQRNPRYSLRKFAMELGISSGSLTDFLNGKRVFSQKVLLKIISKLKLTEKELAEFNELPQEPIREFDGGNLTLHFHLNEEGRKKSRKLRKDFIKKLIRIETLYYGNLRETVSIVETNHLE